MIINRGEVLALSPRRVMSQAFSFRSIKKELSEIRQRVLAGKLAELPHYFALRSRPRHGGSSAMGVRLAMRAPRMHRHDPACFFGRGRGVACSWRCKGALGGGCNELRRQLHPEHLAFIGVRPSSHKGRCGGSIDVENYSDWRGSSGRKTVMDSDELRTERARPPTPLSATPGGAIRRSQLRRMVPLSDTTIYEMEQRGEFPRRFYLTARCAAWDLDEVMSWLQSRKVKSSENLKPQAPFPDVRLRRRNPIRRPGRPHKPTSNSATA